HANAAMYYLWISLDNVILFGRGGTRIIPNILEDICGKVVQIPNESDRCSLRHNTPTSDELVHTFLWNTPPSRAGAVSLAVSYYFISASRTRLGQIVVSQEP